MPYHRFKVGQTVYAPPGGLDALIPHGPFVIVRLLPLVDGEPHYRVRGTLDGREWAVLELLDGTALGNRFGDIHAAKGNHHRRVSDAFQRLNNASALAMMA